MLRDELEAALNDMIIAVREAAHGYETAESIAGRSEASGVFAAAHKDHLKFAVSLEEEQRALGHLPKETDAESTFARDALSHVKASLPLDDFALLLDERRQDEARIVERGQALLGQSISGRLTSVVRDTMQCARDHCAQLDALSREHGNGG